MNKTPFCIFLIIFVLGLFWQNDPAYDYILYF